MRDLPAYLRRIGFEGTPGQDLETLRGIALGHPSSITFENLDAFVGRRVSLAPHEVEQKLVARGRGGWCFEQNLLLGEALRAIGFAVTDLAARVIWGRPVDAPVPRTHRLLLVEAEGVQWLLDAGFGGQTLTGTIDIDSDVAQPTPHEPFRLRRLGSEQVLESQIRGEWLHLFRFDRQPQLPVDFEPVNFQLAHDSGSHFTQGFTVSRVTHDGRNVLRGHPMHGVELAFHRGGETQRSSLATAPEIMTAMQDLFALPLSELPELPGRLKRMLEQVAVQTGSAARS